MQWLILFTILIILSACARDEAGTSSVSSATTPGTVRPSKLHPARHPNGPTMMFFDTERFDKQLSETLRRGPEAIIVTFGTFLSVNTIPQRLNKWFSAVEKYKGKVQFQPYPDYPSNAEKALPLLSAAMLAYRALIVLYEAYEQMMLYSPAKEYNSIVYYARDSGKIIKVVFIHK